MAPKVTIPKTTATRTAPPRADEWLTLKEASRISKLGVRNWNRIAQRHSSDSLARKAPPPHGKGKRVWWVHISIHPKLSPAPRPPVRDVHSRYPKHKADAAHRKCYWLLEWRKLCDGARDAGATSKQLAARIVAQAKQANRYFRISYRTLQWWWAAYNRLDPDGQIMGMEGLIDNRGHCGANRGAVRSPQAWDYFCSLYRRREKPTIRSCHDATLAEAHQRGWNWPASYSATRNWLSRYDDKVATCLAREGKAVCRKRFPGAIKGAVC